MSKKFVPTLRTADGYTYLKLQGVLDEDNTLSRLVSQIQGKYLIIELSEIERINSCGVRDWVNWLNQVQAIGTEVILLNCSPSVIGQINMVMNFSSDAYIYSFFAPYVNPDTEEEVNVLLLTKDLLASSGPLKAPTATAEDGTELEFDEFEESYFAFLTDSKVQFKQISPELQPVLDYFTGDQVRQSGNVRVSSPNEQKSARDPKEIKPLVMDIRHEQPPLPVQNYKHLSVDGQESVSSPSVAAVSTPSFSGAPQLEKIAQDSASEYSKQAQPAVSEPASVPSSEALASLAKAQHSATKVKRILLGVIVILTLLLVILVAVVVLKTMGII